MKEALKLLGRRHISGLYNVEISIFVVSLLILPFLWPVFFPFEQESEQHIEVPDQKKANYYGVTAFDMPEYLNFAGEPVPMYNPDVSESFDRELLVNTYWHSQTFLFFKRANKWFPVIEEIFEEKGVPEDFKYMALIESGLTNAVSPAGAVGFWQLMKSTAQDHDMVMNNEIDERYNVRKSTEVAADYLVRAYENFGSWTLAAASYNMGITGIKRVQNRQNVYSYYDMALNPETARFVYRILAVKEVFENPAKYGFNFSEEQLYHNVPTRKIEVDGRVNSWVDFANEHGITYKELRSFNPWIRSRELRNRQGHTFEVKVPARTYADTVSINIPEGEKFADVRERKRRILGLPDEPEGEFVEHEVSEDETLYSIAEDYQVQKSSILQWNNLKKDAQISAGEAIKIKKPIE